MSQETFSAFSTLSVPWPSFLAQRKRRPKNTALPVHVNVVLPILSAVFAAQIVVVHQLDAALADEVTLTQILVLGQLSLIDFTDESHRVRGHRAVRIVAALHGRHVQLGKEDRLCLNRR